MSEDPEKKAPVPVEPAPETGSWKLPSGFENVIEDGTSHLCISIALLIIQTPIVFILRLRHAGIVKVAAGAVAGGVLGLALARTGKGGRLGYLGAGVGVGLGSMYERALESFQKSK
jgi:hypothetical protein